MCGSFVNVVILSSILAWAAAAPSGGLITPIITPVAIAAPIPTIPPGDIEAAAIDAKVQAEDQARFLSEQASAFNEQTTMENSEKLIQSEDIAKEKAGEAFWAAEEQKWQAIEAANQAQAQLESTAASASPDLAKSAVAPVIVHPAPIPYIAPVVYTPGFVAPSVKIAESLSQLQTEKKPEELKGVEVKTAEPKPEENKDKEEKKPEGVTLDLTAGKIVAPFAFYPHSPVALAPLHYRSPLFYPTIVKYF